MKSLSAFSAAVFLQARAIDKQSLARLHKLFIDSPFPALLLPSGMRSPDPGFAPEPCPNPDLNQTGCNTLVEEAAQTTTLPAGGAYQQLLNLVSVCNIYEYSFVLILQ